MLNDVAAERGVISAICRYGSSSYVEISDIIPSPNTFTIDSNQIIYKCLQHIFEQDINSKVDIPLVYSAAKSIGVSDFLDSKNEREHLRAMFNFPILQESAVKMAAKIRKLEIARLLDDQLDEIKYNISKVSGDESIDSILALVESPVVDFSNALCGSVNETKLLFENIDEHLNYVENNAGKPIGISSGYPIYDYSIGGGFRRGTVNLIGARLKTGKAAPLDTLLYTPNGPIKMGEVKVGDIICTPNGKTAKVRYIFPQGIKDVYKVTFADGAWTECCDEHLWEVRTTKWQNRNKKYILPLSEIRKIYKSDNTQKRLKIDLSNDVAFNKQKVPIDPYLMGLMIGDGSFCTEIMSFSTGDLEIIDKIKNILEDTTLHIVETKGIDYGYNITQKIPLRESNGWYSSSPFKEAIKSLGLLKVNSHKKFIPDCYKYNTRDVRQSILQGLMDTDGSVDQNGYASYSTVSAKLAIDFQFIARSLGYMTIITGRRKKYRVKRTKEIKWSFAYDISVIAPDNRELFRLSRKKNRCHKRIKSFHRTIKNVEYVGKKECQCINIDSEDGLYLTDNFIITHNSQIATNVGLFTSKQLNIPTLYLDTEMASEDHLNRILANLTSIPINEIETGKYCDSEINKEKIRNIAKEVKKLPFYYRNIAGAPFEEIISHIRRWLLQTVGKDENGKIKDCLVVYDYIKLMDTSAINGNMAEWQALGFLMTSLTNFAIKYDIPILSFIQLNRDGINSESTASASGSDRLLWFCSNFSIYKKKSDEEIELDGLENGTHKLVPIVCRHGGGLQDREYINFKMTGKYGRIQEHKTNFQVQRELNQFQQVKANNDVKDSEEEQIQF